MPQCISAMLVFNRDEDAQTNAEAMIESLNDVKTIQVTYSVRNTTFNEMAIEKDDYLAVADGDIKAVGKDLKTLIIEAIEKTIDESNEILSMYYGADVTKEQADEVAEWIEEAYPELELDVYYGGQPVYYFVFSLE